MTIDPVAMTDTRQVLEEAWERITVRPPSYALACRDDSNSDETLRKLGEQVWDWAERKARFHRFLDAEAWTDAALMLVPEGWLWRLMPSDTQGHWLSEVWADGTGDCEFGARADHPSLALAQAALRAQEAGDV